VKQGQGQQREESQHADIVASGTVWRTLQHERAGATSRWDGDRLLRASAIRN
jgi:hypothetical protein